MEFLNHKKFVKVGLAAIAFIFVLGLGSSQKLMAQNADKVYKIVDQMPEIEGGLPALYKKIDYPKEAVRKGISGRVFLQVVIDENGTPKNPKVIRDIGGGCGQAAMDAIAEVHFKPGKKNGKKVKVKYSLPVIFKFKDR